MNTASKMWNNFKSQPDIWFFYGFLLTFTLSVRKVLFFYPINNQFNEYTGIYLYLSDIFLVLALVSWGITILRNKYNKLSRNSTSVFPVEHNKLLVVIPILLVIWSFLSIFWSDNQSIALFRSIKVLEFYLLFLYILYNVSHGTILRNIFKITVFLGVLHSIIGIWQFFAQRSVGLFWLKESLISPELPGIAKIILNGEKFIRSYGLFPHPNVLGGFLVFSIVMTFLYYKLFYVEHTTRKAWSTNRSRQILLIIQITALVLTFSKSAILGLIIATSYILWKMWKSMNNVSYGTKSAKRMFYPSTNVPRETCYGAGVEHFYKKFILAIIILVLLFFIVKPDIYTFFIKSANERLFYLDVSYGTLLTNPVLGIGQGQFVTNLSNLPDILDWQFQPVHNVYLLILNELGIIGLTLFLWFLWKMFHVKHNLMTIYFKAVFIVFLFVMFFDHYLWDIQQGQILLWLSVGLLVISSQIPEE